MPDDFDPTTVTWVLTDDDLEHLCTAVYMATEAVMDLETTGLDEHAYRGGPTNAGYPARIVLASLTLPLADDTGDPSTWVLPLSHPDSPWLGRWRSTMARVAECLVDARVPMSNQNLKFDARWVFAHTGVDISVLIAWDTLVSSHLLDENASTKLKERAPATFGVERWDDFDLSVPGAAERMPMFDLGMYAARDTYWDWRLTVLHREELALAEGSFEPQTADEVEAARLGRLARWCAMPMVATLTAVEQRGITLDVDWTVAALEENRSLARDLGWALAERYGADPAEMSYAPTSHWFRDWTQAAIEAGDLIVAALTPTGAPQWTKGVLVRQARNGSEVAESLLRLRGATKKAEYLESWLHYVTPLGTIHTTYNAGRVATGRLSSTDPNIQQVTESLKPAFVPRKGYLLADLDYGQIEMRIAAFISRCVPMLEAFRRGDDLHRLLASRITGKPPEVVSAEERQAGKSANFGLLYQMGVYGFREYAETVYGVSFTMEEAALVHRTFFETWEGIQAWHLRAIQRARQTGQVVSPIGRVRRVPGIWDGNEQVAAYYERVAVNAPVQGFASDVMQIAAASIEGRLPGHAPVPDARIVATVHDDIVVEVPEDRWKEVTLACQERMLSVGPVLASMDCHLDVPLTVDVKVGTRWGLSDVAVLT